MKITDPDIIKNGEKDLIDAVKNDLNLDAVKEILEKRMAGSSLSPDDGQIVVHNNEIAFRINFNIQLSGSLMFDRQGNYIPESVDDPSGTADAETDMDMDDLDIGGTLEEIGPESGSNEDDLPDIGDDTKTFEPDSDEDDPDDEEFNISLPDYDLDDPEAENGDIEPDLLLDEDLSADAPGEPENISDDSDDLFEEDSDLEHELDSLNDATDVEDLTDIEEPDAAGDEQKDIDDEDINDILKESRDFWEQKKDS